MSSTDGAAGEAATGAAAPRVAIAHDYLTQRGGAERVVLALLRAFPDATLHTTLYDPAGTFPEFAGARIRTSWLNRITPLRRDHRRALPLLPFAARSLRIDDADVVIASTTGWAHGFPTTARKLVYCHSPARYLYLSHEYLGRPALRTPIGWALLALRPWLIRWDQRAARTADRYLCNSRVVRDRIARVYGLDAEVVPPPFGVDAAGAASEVVELADWASEGYHLVVSRLLPYKNVGAVVEAFRGLPGERLAIVGRGPLEDALRAALPGNARLLTGLSDAELRWAYAHATALIAPSHEDFGLTPLEAAAFGKPCLALHAGGYLDTIEPGLNGTFFAETTASAIAEAVRANRGAAWDADAIRRHAEGFSEEAFARRLREQVEALAALGPPG